MELTLVSLLTLTKIPLCSPRALKHNELRHQHYPFACLTVTTLYYVPSRVAIRTLFLFSPQAEPEGMVQL